MLNRKKVYVETTVISDLTSRPSPLVRNLARQLATKDGFKCPLIGTPDQLKEVRDEDD